MNSAEISKCELSRDFKMWTQQRFQNVNSAQISKYEPSTVWL